MPVDSRIIENASQSLNLLAKSYDGAGEAARAEELFRAAADLELTSPELQACWGGPFNGQVGRQTIMRGLLGLLDPAAVVETGTFRGISLEWFAQHYTGSIFSCEIEKLYFLQAQARLASYSNVDIRLSDSRQFLKDILDQLATDRPILLYLDAHWERDLPVREELRIVFAARPKAVAVVDDFRVPDEPGYGWDDYGTEDALEVKLLDGVIPTHAQLFFPRMKASEETGARRGCCVIAGDSASIVARSTLLRGGSFEVWLAIQEAAPTLVFEPGKSPVGKKENAAKLDVSPQNHSYPRVIADLSARLETLDEQLKESEADRAARLEVINRLDKQLKESEADRAARLEVINRLDKQLKESEADRAARLEVINRLDKQLKESEADRAARLERLTRLYSEINGLRTQNTDEPVTDDRTALQVLQNVNRIINSRFVRLWRTCRKRGFRQDD